MKKKFFILFIITILNGCQDRSLKHQMIEKLDNTNSQNIKLKLKDFTNFKWEKFYYFEFTSLEQVDSILGFSLPYNYDMGIHLIFVSGNRVVYHEDEFIYPDSKPKETRIYFLTDTNTSYLTINYKDDSFYVKRIKTDNDSYYYMLIPVVTRLHRVTQSFAALARVPLSVSYNAISAKSRQNASGSEEE